MPFQVKDLISAVSDSVVLPGTCARVNDMINDPRYCAADIAEAVSKDADMSARLLKIANSHFFSFPSHIDTVAKAITIIGTEEFRQLVLATSVIQLFSRLPNELVSMETFWRHSLRCAMIARSLASHLHEPNPEHYFTSGLLHDIGYLIIYRELPELAAKTLKHSTQNREIVYIVEQEIIGFDHAAVAGELLRQWNLPSEQVEAVEFHHTPSLAKNFPKHAAIVHIANYLANTMIVNMSPGMETTEALDMQTLDIVGLTPDILQNILKQADGQFNDTLEVIIYDQVA